MSEFGARSIFIAPGESEPPVFGCVGDERNPRDRWRRRGIDDMHPWIEVVYWMGTWENCSRHLICGLVIVNVCMYVEWYGKYVSWRLGNVESQYVRRNAWNVYVPTFTFTNHHQPLFTINILKDNIQTNLLNTIWSQNLWIEYSCSTKPYYNFWKLQLL